MMMPGFPITSTSSKHQSVGARSTVVLLVLLIGGSILAPNTALAQPESWTAHTSFRSVVELTQSDDDLWVATTGGLYRYIFESGEIQTFTTVEGLHDISLGAIAFDSVNNALWIGYGDGVLQKLDVTSGNVRTFLDVSRASQFTSRNIRKIVPAEGRLFIATGFGVVVWDTASNEVDDSYTRFGTLPAGSPVFDVLPAPLPDGQDGLWVSVDQGVAYAPQSASNLREPDVWTVETGLPSGRSLGLVGTGVLAGTVSDAYFRTGDGSWSPMGFTDGPVTDMTSCGNRLCVSTPFWFIILDASGNRVRVLSDGFVEIASTLLDSDGTVWTGDGGKGVARFSNVPLNGVESLTPQQVLIPRGPYHGLFADLTLAPDGSLWAGAVPSENGGFYHLDDAAEWTDFRREEFAGMQDRFRLDRIHADSKGKIWAGGITDGQGLLSYDIDGTFELFTQSNSSLRSVPGQPAEDIRVSGISSSVDGTVWVTNFLTSPRLHVRTTDGTWTGFNGLRDEFGGSVTGDFTDVFVDSHGQVWLPLRFDRGVLVIDPSGTPSDFFDDRSRWFRGRGSGGLGLPGPQVNVIAEDRKGGIWLGTDRGLASFLFGNLAIESEPAWPIRDGAFVLRDLFINDIAVDPSNRLWIASNEGVWQLDGSTYEIISHYTTENSPLFSDNIIAVEVDPLSGRVYFATTGGLISLAGTATAPATEAQTLHVFPNPVRGDANGNPQIFIEGLVEETDLSIVTVSGDLITRFETRGGRTVWDGKDREGNLVPSGMYLVIAVGKSGEGTALGKVAIIR